jgi:hypothetical protein
LLFVDTILFITFYIDVLNFYAEVGGFKVYDATIPRSLRKSFVGLLNNNTVCAELTMSVFDKELWSSGDVAVVDLLQSVVG